MYTQTFCAGMPSSKVCHHLLFAHSLDRILYSRVIVCIRSAGTGFQLHGIKPLERCLPDRLPAGFSRWIATEFLAPLLRGEQLVRSTRHPPDIRRAHLLAVKSQDEHALQGDHRFRQCQGQKWWCGRRNIYAKRAGETAGGQTRQVDRFDYFFLFFTSFFFFVCVCRVSVPYWWNCWCNKSASLPLLVVILPHFFLLVAPTEKKCGIDCRLQCALPRKLNV